MTKNGLSAFDGVPGRKNATIKRALALENLPVVAGQNHGVNLADRPHLRVQLDDSGAGAGFTNITFMNCPVVYDDQCNATRMYLLNTDFLFLRPAKGREFKPLGDKASVNQDAMVVPVVWAGNLTTSNRGLQAVLCA